MSSLEVDCYRRADGICNLHGFKRSLRVARGARWLLILTIPYMR